jgi:hypothetical protein
MKRDFNSAVSKTTLPKIMQYLNIKNILVLNYHVSSKLVYIILILALTISVCQGIPEEMKSTLAFLKIRKTKQNENDWLYCLARETKLFTNRSVTDNG